MTEPFDAFALRRAAPRSTSTALPAKTLNLPLLMRITLFVTCFIDSLYPNVAISMVPAFRAARPRGRLPGEATCCGQPPFNSGYWDEARAVAREAAEAFQDAEVVVSGSGSCGAMFKKFYPELFAGQPQEAKAKLAAKTWEFSEFLVNKLGVTNVGAKFRQGDLPRRLPRPARTRHESRAARTAPRRSEAWNSSRWAKRNVLRLRRHVRGEVPEDLHRDGRGEMPLDLRNRASSGSCATTRAASCKSRVTWIATARTHEKPAPRGGARADLRSGRCGEPS